MRKGFKMLDHQRLKTLLTRLPDPPPAGVSGEAIQNFEQTTGITIPPDFTELLKVSNGPIIGHQKLFGLTDARQGDVDILSDMKAYPNFMSSGWIPIGSDGFGNRYVIPTRQEFGEGYPVLFFDIINDINKPAYIVASDIQHFIEYLIEDELDNNAYIFDRTIALRYDPNLLRFKRLTFPWED